MKDFDITQEKFDYVIALFNESTSIILLSCLQILMFEKPENNKRII